MKSIELPSRRSLIIGAPAIIGVAALGIRPAFAATTIFSATINTGAGSFNNYAFRTGFVTTGGNQGQLQVTFHNGSGSTATVKNASIGIGNTDPATTGITELLFTGDPNGGVGGHGFTIAAGASAVSDWLTFSGGAAATDWVVDTDIDATLGIASYGNTFSVGSAVQYFKSATADYLTNATTSYVNNGAFSTFVSLIQTQVAPGGASGSLQLMGLGQ